MNRHLIQTSLWWRNGLFYSLLGLLVITFNLDGLRESLRDNPRFVAEVGLYYTLTYGLCFTHNHVLYRRHLRQKRYRRYGLGVAGLFFLWVVANGLLSPYDRPNWSNTVFSGLIVLLFGWGLYLIYQQVFVTTLQLRNALYSSRSEVAQLRAQMNPHFLFNALNNLYGISVSEPGRVPDYVLMLSDLLRYQIESSQQYRVRITEEVDFLHQLVHYEQLKLGHRATIGWRVDVPPTSTCRIAPMLLYPFLENAFKYGGQLPHPVVEASLSLNRSHLTFCCRNLFDAQRRAEKSGTQTGLNNTRQRLRLLYPDAHELTITETSDQFLVSLQLTLTDHDH